MPQYRISYEDVTRMPDRDVRVLTMAVHCDDEYLGLYSTTLEGRIFHLRTFSGESIEMGVRWAWVKATAELIEDSIRHGEAPRTWSAEVRPLALSAARVIDHAHRAVTLAESSAGFDLGAPETFVATFDCFTPDRQRWEFRSGRGKKRCNIDLCRGVGQLSDEIRHGNRGGTMQGPGSDSPWSRPGIVTLV